MVSSPLEENITRRYEVDSKENLNTDLVYNATLSGLFLVNEKIPDYNLWQYGMHVALMCLYVC